MKDQKEWQQAETEMLKFHDFDKDKIFEGRYLEDYVPNIEGADWSAHRFETEDGDHVLIGKYHAIDKAVEKYGDKYDYRFEFTGMKDLEKGKQVREFKIHVRKI